MAMEGLLALVCAAAVVTAGPAPNSPPPAPEGDALAVTLAVQTAMQQGREHLLRNDPRQAVEVLEEQLPRINGNATYLALLRDAYRQYIQELRLENQEALAQKYVTRLLILDPRATGLKALRTAHAVAASPPAPPPTTARGKIDDDDPFQRLADRGRNAHGMLEQAEREFGRSQFREADRLFEKAHQADPASTDGSKPRWAYCKLHEVVEQLNQQSTAYAALEAEVRAALEMAPQLKFGDQLLEEIRKRRAGPPDAGQAGAEVVVRDLGRDGEGWYVAETTNFRIYHNQPREMVERTARVAERTRTDMQRKWFGRTGDSWNPKCEIYLHATAQDYSRATGVPANSPGHSSFRLEGNRVTGRRIDLHCDDPNLLTAVLPHEATHTVLAGNFGDHPVPRWADEGMAVLTEPRDKIERHLRNLPRHYQDGQLFSVGQLMQMNDYPEARYVGPFYAQSVSLVEFLSAKRGPEVFTCFVREGLKGGYEPALRKHYGYRDFTELEQDWKRHAFGESGAAGVALRNP